MHPISTNPVLELARQTVTASPALVPLPPLTAFMLPIPILRSTDRDANIAPATVTVIAVLAVLKLARFAPITATAPDFPLPDFGILLPRHHPLRGHTQITAATMIAVTAAGAMLKLARQTALTTATLQRHYLIFFANLAKWASRTTSAIEATDDSCISAIRVHSANFSAPTLKNSVSLR
jgi:hypothetical protein